MIIEDIDGTWKFGLNILSYEFDLPDDEWLVLSLHVEKNDFPNSIKQEWRWKDPSLTYYEAVYLADWLESIAKRQPFESNLDFIENEFWLTLDTLDADIALITVGMAGYHSYAKQGLLEQWELSEHPFFCGKYYSKCFCVSHENLLIAADSLRKDIESLPFRKLKPISKMRKRIQNMSLNPLDEEYKLMKLKNIHDGWEFGFKILGFENEFAPDLNWIEREWLTLLISVSSPVQCWNWNDPALAYREIPKLADWFDAIVSGEKVSKNISFYDVELHMKLIRRNKASAVIRIGLYARSGFDTERQPFRLLWQRERHPTRQTLENYKDFTVPLTSLSEAAETLRSDLSNLPPREFLPGPFKRNNK